VTLVEYIVFGILLHLVADWFLQNEWMAINKVKWNHPAAIVHAAIHWAVQIPIFGPWAVLIFITHYLIDLRTPLVWWGRVFKQTAEGPVAVHVAIWRDQVAHFVVIALVALFLV
jgi:hypothetical protein